MGTVLEGATVPAGEEFPYGGILDPLKAAHTGPRAYLNYLIFDKNFTFLDGNYVPLTGGKENGSGVDHQKLETGYIDIEQQGYVYIYLSNDNPQPLEVYFDDFLVEHIQTPVIQVDDYYPFGLTFNSFKRDNQIANNFKFNGFEEQVEWGVYDYLARYYDRSLGRFINIDPAADSMRRHSPYNYAFDNPIRFIDPDGMVPEDVTEVTPPTEFVNEKGEQIAKTDDGSDKVYVVREENELSFAEDMDKNVKSEKDLNKQNNDELGQKYGYLLEDMEKEANPRLHPTADSERNLGFEWGYLTAYEGSPVKIAVNEVVSAFAAAEEPALGRGYGFGSALGNTHRKQGKMNMFNPKTSGTKASNFVKTNRRPWELRKGTKTRDY